MSVGGGQETRGGFGVPSDVGQSLRERVNAPGRDLMKTHNARACVPQRGPRGSVGFVRGWIRMLGGSGSRGYRERGSTARWNHPVTFPCVGLTALAHPKVIPARRAAGGVRNVPDDRMKPKLRSPSHSKGCSERMQPQEHAGRRAAQTYPHFSVVRSTPPQAIHGDQSTSSSVSSRRAASDQRRLPCGLMGRDGRPPVTGDWSPSRRSAPLSPEQDCTTFQRRQRPLVGQHGHRRRSE